MTGQMSIFDFIPNVKKKIVQEDADLWFIKNSTPIFHNGKPTFKVNKTGDIVNYAERVVYMQTMC